jgi:hypothetical protein
MLTIISAAALFVREKAAAIAFRKDQFGVAGVPAVRISFAHDGSSIA